MQINRTAVCYCYLFAVYFRHLLLVPPFCGLVYQLSLLFTWDWFCADVAHASICGMERVKQSIFFLIFRILDQKKERRKTKRNIILASDRMIISFVLINRIPKTLHPSIIELHCMVKIKEISQQMKSIYHECREIFIMNCGKVKFSVIELGKIQKSQRHFTVLFRKCWYLTTTHNSIMKQP